MIIGDDINITNSDKKVAIFILHLNIQRIDSGKQMRKLENYQFRKKTLKIVWVTLIASPLKLTLLSYIFLIPKE